MNSKCPKYHPSCSVTAQATASAGNNALVRSYTWGLDASGSMQGAGGVGGLLMVNAGSGGVHFPAYDLNGNVMGLVNATSGNISAKYEYGPFGEVFCSVGDMAEVNPFQFSTKYTDNETDFVYYGYRYYSPPLGRWLSRDPIEEQGGLNLYGFVNNDPVNKWDNLGLQVCCEPRKDPTGVSSCVYHYKGLIWHAYSQIGSWTVGWAGDPPEEESLDGKITNCVIMKRRSRGNLPDGTPCKCATASQLQSCVKDRYWPSGTYLLLVHNCGTWAREVAKRCCMDTVFRAPNGDKIIYGPSFGWDWKHHN